MERYLEGNSRTCTLSYLPEVDDVRLSAVQQVSVEYHITVSTEKQPVMLLRHGHQLKVLYPPHLETHPGTGTQYSRLEWQKKIYAHCLASLLLSSDSYGYKLKYEAVHRVPEHAQVAGSTKQHPEMCTKLRIIQTSTEPSPSSGMWSATFIGFLWSSLPSTES